MTKPESIQDRRKRLAFIMGMAYSYGLNGCDRGGSVAQRGI
jgi:hypothetical protein